VQFPENPRRVSVRGRAGSRWWAPVAMTLMMAACDAGDGRTPVVVYSPHGRDQLELLERAFEREHADVDLRWLDMGSQDILDRVRSERVNPQADVWFGGPTVLFERGVRDSLLEPYRPVWADHVGPSGVDSAGHYFPVYRTPAVLVYNSVAVPREEVPEDWDEVLEPRWRDQVLIRDPLASGTMRAIWGLIIQRGMRFPGDTAPGMAWLRRLDGQTRTYTMNPALLTEKLSRQEGTLTLWDLPDVLISIGKGMPFGYVFPRSGTAVIDDAIGLIRGTRNPEAAKQFIDFVGSESAQILAAREVFRLPARHGLPVDSIPPWVADVERAMVEWPMDWGLLSREGERWMGYWDRRVRGTGRTR